MVFLSELYLVQGNPFYIILDQIYMIGKNDLFLAAGVLAASVHAPVGQCASSRAHLPGLVFATLLVLATKPAGMFAVAPLWLPVLWGWWKDWRAGGRFPARELALAALGILPGGLWIVRNLLVIDTIFPEGVWVMNEWSIANNLTNPFFYAHLPRNFIFLLVVLALALGFTVWKRLPGWRILLVFIVLFIAFLITPESGFQKTTQEPTRVAWRLGIALVLYELLVLLILLEGFILRALAWLAPRRAAQSALAGVLILGSLALSYERRGHLEIIPGNEIVLRDEFRQSVGVDGYHSPYDYVQRNIRGQHHRGQRRSLLLHLRAGLQQHSHQTPIPTRALLHGPAAGCAVLRRHPARRRISHHTLNGKRNGRCSTATRKALVFKRR